MKKCITLLFSLVLTASSFAASGGAHWGYQGVEGPQNWGNLSKDYEMCRAGKSQSPINVSKTKKAELGAIEFNYRPNELAVVNNGHTIQQNYEKGSTITVQGNEYALKQFHFHHSSENTINGKSFAMEMHLVHANDKGELAVVGVMFKEGKHNNEIGKIWANLPAKINDENEDDDIVINASNLVPLKGSYYHWSGSLTTPPCTEGVEWHLMQQPLEVSKAQVAKFVESVGINNRPILPLNGRVVDQVNVKKTKFKNYKN